MKRKTISIYVWLFIWVTAPVLYLIAFLIWLSTVLFDNRLRLLHQFGCFWAGLYFDINPLWKITISGKENIPRNQACIMVANHQSMVDILVLYKLFVHFKWVSKKEVFRVPFFGWNMELNRYIKLDRVSRRSIAKMINEANENLDIGNPVMIFPEGTRSANGEIKKFKEGAFALALKSSVPIVPIVIMGTAEVIGKSPLFFHPNRRMQMHILPAIDSDSFKEKDSALLTAMVQELMKKELLNMKVESSSKQHNSNLNSLKRGQ